MAKITDFVGERLESFLEDKGLALYNCTFSKEGKDWFLRVYVDKKSYGTTSEEYIGTEECEEVSRYLSQVLDSEDPIEQNYYLEVSSPGLDRQLISIEHFTRYVGSLVVVKLYKQVEGKKEYVGILKNVDGSTSLNSITVECDNKEFIFNKDNIAKVNLEVVF